MQGFIVFRLGEENFAVEIEKVFEVFNPARVFPVPELEKFITGVINVRGKVVPVVDLRIRFGITPRPGKERTVLTRTKLETLGLLVDDVMGIMEFDPKEITKPPAIFRGLSSKSLNGLLRDGDDVILILNLDNLLSADEKLKLEETRDLMQGIKQ